MQIHTGCICWTFLHYVFSNASSKHLHNRMHSHIGCICLAFLHCGFSNVSLNCRPEVMQSRIGCICLAFLRCVFSNVSSNCLPQLMQSHIDCTCLTYRLPTKGAILRWGILRFTEEFSCREGQLATEVKPGKGNQLDNKISFVSDICKRKHNFHFLCFMNKKNIKHDTQNSLNWLKYLH